MSTSALDASYARAARDYEARTPHEGHTCIGCEEADVLDPMALCDECCARAERADSHRTMCDCADCSWRSCLGCDRDADEVTL